jgi:hypothetical protein
MKSRTIQIQGKTIYLLSDANTDTTRAGNSGETKDIVTKELLVAARRNPDAVAFGYTAGRWVAGA